MVEFTRGRPDDPARDQDDLSGHTHRQLLGYIGLLLPALLVFMVIARDGMTRWRSLDSISAYYYTGAVVAFVGMLVSMALFLFTYRGYNNKYYWADRAAGITAAIAALGVAVFPTKAPNGVLPLLWWTPTTRVLHYASAVVLFAMFAVFALWLFRRTGSQVSPRKNRRNTVYLICGLLIVASMIWAAIAGLNRRAIFWPESIALVAFAVSWLVKGEALKTIVDTARSVTRRGSTMKNGPTLNPTVSTTKVPLS